MEEDQELQNPFPSPPSHYVNYTYHNLQLLSLFKSRLEESNESLDDVDIVRKQHELLASEKDVPDWPLTQLEKPRVDWILDEGEYTVFGETWPTTERIASLGQLGGTQLYPEDPTVDRRPALQSVLSTLLFTYSNFLSSVIAPPVPPNEDRKPDWDDLLNWMRIMGQNLIGAANDLRPVQARANLEAMMTRQLELRQEETKAIHTTCDSLETKLMELKKSVETSISASESDASHKKGNVLSNANAMDVDASFGSTTLLGTPKLNGISIGMTEGSSQKPDSEVTEADMLRWAEEAEIG
ncbi:hypothetical protein M422DRAFT_778408 [Sphaerobolus stellatus SS14]|nr:hypothetical protein M422DRAFT_778408 [Sphaerobolus stellatus SS14]